MKKNAWLKNVLIGIVALVFMASAYYIYDYYTDTDVLDIPLAEGMTFKYDGIYLTRGTQRTIEMEAPIHRLVVEREFEFEGEKRFLLALWIADQRVHAMILTKTPEGIFWVMGRNRKIFIIPRNVKRGQKWEFDIGSRHIKASVGKEREIETGTGVYKAREIFYQSNDRTRIRLWVEKSVGIVKIDFSSLGVSGGGASREQAKLTLQEVEEKSKKP